MTPNQKPFKIFIINPGSTSTKLSYFLDGDCQVTDETFHDSSELLRFPSINHQLDFRMGVLHSFLKEHNIDLRGVDAIVGRGGPCRAVPGGSYAVDDSLIADTRACVGGVYHASMLGVQMARALQEEYGGLTLMVDPPVVDELQPLARLSGVKGIHRRAVCHALNLKAAARQHAKRLGRPYEALNLIVCHIDGGISITAHRQGRMIDGNDAGGGEGPFTPTRMGTMAVTDVINRLRDRSCEEIKALCSQAGGLSSYFGTSNSDRVHARAEEGDPAASLVWEAMIYQTAKVIGSMAVVLEGRVDGIVLTGGLLRFEDVAEGIRQRCGWIAPVSVYPGEFEQQAMADAALRVLRGEERLLPYPGRALCAELPAGV